MITPLKQSTFYADKKELSCSAMIIMNHAVEKINVTVEVLQLTALSEVS